MQEWSAWENIKRVHFDTDVNDVVDGNDLKYAAQIKRIIKSFYVQIR
jgi:hypothetical protein